MLENQRHLFDKPENFHYLNCAYMSPLPGKTGQVGDAAMSLIRALFRVMV
ncbi:MAG: hypothetical protein GY726_13770 [Proteobacteria bacterium]|nr:hypothetical protein [Pseudomonadota bacterium]